MKQIYQPLAFLIICANVVPCIPTLNLIRMVRDFCIWYRLSTRVKQNTHKFSKTHIKVMKVTRARRTRRVNPEQMNQLDKLSHARRRHERKPKSSENTAPAALDTAAGREGRWWRHADTETMAAVRSYYGPVLCERGEGAVVPGLVYLKGEGRGCLGVAPPTGPNCPRACPVSRTGDRKKATLEHTGQR